VFSHLSNLNSIKLDDEEKLIPDIKPGKNPEGNFFKKVIIKVNVCTGYKTGTKKCFI
jgi:hypothetical protein